MAVSTRAAEAGKTFSEAISAGVAAMTVPRLTRVVYHAGSAMAPALNAAAAVAAPPARRKAAAAASTAAAAAAAATTAATTASSSSPPLPPIEGLLVRVLPSPSAASVAVGDVVAFHAPAVSPEEARAVGAWPSEGQAGVRFFVFELGEERGRESRGESDFFFSLSLFSLACLTESKLPTPTTTKNRKIEITGPRPARRGLRGRAAPGLLLDLFLLRPGGQGGRGRSNSGRERSTGSFFFLLFTFNLLRAPRPLLGPR